MEDQKQALQSSQVKNLPMIPITKPSDLLKAKPIKVMIREHGDKSVKETISMAVTKCCNQIGIDMHQSQLNVLVEDLIEKYSTDSVEDIVECLKKGRRGNYGTVYNKFNMIVISEWMSYHLSEKADAREAEVNRHKTQAKDEIDYSKVDTSKIGGIKKNPWKDAHYEAFKGEYFEKNEKTKTNP